MRRRTTSRATLIASFSAWAVPLGVGVSTMRVEIDDLHVPVAVAGQRHRLGQVAHAARPPRRPWSDRGPGTTSRPPAVEMSPMSMRGSRRSSVATSSSIAWRRCFCASAASASSSRWLPPARSRPRLILYCGSQFGQCAGLGRPGDQAGNREQDAERDDQRRPARLSSAEIRASVVRRLRVDRQHLADRRLDDADLRRPARSRPRPPRR